MATSQKLLTTREFSKKAGVSSATVSSWLKKGKIKGKKAGNKWLIPESELKHTTPVRPKQTNKAASSNGKSKATAAKNKSAPKGSQSNPKKARSTTSSQSYSVEAFSDITFLTTFGVEKWLKEGRLTGGVDASGNKCVDAANLENPLVKRLLR